jgi:hypothetical protein
MGLDKIMRFLWVKAPNAIQEPVALHQSFPRARVMVDAFPMWWRCFCSLFGGVNDPNGRQVQVAVQFFEEIVDQWLDDYHFTVTFVVDPAVASLLKQPEQQRRIQARRRAQQRSRTDIQRNNQGNLNARRRQQLLARALSQGFGGNQQGLDNYLEKRRRQLRSMGVVAVTGFTNAILQRLNQGRAIQLVYAPQAVEGEMWCCRLADQAVLNEQRRPVNQRRAVVVITPDSDVLAYRSDPRVAALGPRNGWVWCSNVLPNQSNPLNNNYQWQTWWLDPASDTAGIWRAIRPNRVRSVLRLTTSRMTDFAILCKNTVRQSDLKGMTCAKAYDLVRRFGRLEGVNANRNQLPRAAANAQAWAWIYTHRQRLRSYWTHTPVP